MNSGPNKATSPGVISAVYFLTRNRFIFGTGISERKKSLDAKLFRSVKALRELFDSLKLLT